MPALVEPRNPWVTGLLPGGPPSFPGWLQRLIKEPPEAVASELQARDFVFLTRTAIGDRADIVAAAEGMIDRVPSLGAAVRREVGVVFLLGAREEYDVSHSEPRWPNWIFVSAPRAPGIVAGLRFAENVVHEAMHLQLTELEARVPLVWNTTSRLHSPWKQKPRQLQGILHGLYVFACISAFYRQLLTEPLEDQGHEYIQGRLASIGDEAAAVPLEPLAEGLTAAGKQLLDSMGSPVRRACRAASRAR